MSTKTLCTVSIFGIIPTQSYADYIIIPINQKGHKDFEHCSLKIWISDEFDLFIRTSNHFKRRLGMRMVELCSFNAVIFSWFDITEILNINLTPPYVHETCHVMT